MSFNFKRNIKGTISIIGTSEIEPRTEEIAIELGRLLAINKYAVACGGLYGVMEAVCKGAKQEGGLTIGIIPYEDKSRANKFIDVVIPVPFSQARNVVVVLSGDACVAVEGKAGTLSEMCFAWIYGKPIIALTGDEINGWSSKMAGKKIDDRRNDTIYGASSAQEVVDRLNEIFKTKQNIKYKMPTEF
ncbi:MAG TPA: TIGR00725 family protein [Candidatus Nanopelagicaceae bacterium]|nr:TIGR00725 family protein [Candidatus Nanopelagicaceae bacterium]